MRLETQTFCKLYTGKRNSCLQARVPAIRDLVAKLCRFDHSLIPILGCKSVGTPCIHQTHGFLSHWFCLSLDSSFMATESGSARLAQPIRMWWWLGPGKNLQCVGGKTNVEAADARAILPASCQQKMFAVCFATLCAYMCNHVIDMKHVSPQVWSISSSCDLDI